MNAPGVSRGFDHVYKQRNPLSGVWKVMCYTLKLVACLQLNLHSFDSSMLMALFKLTRLLRPWKKGTLLLVLLIAQTQAVHVRLSGVSRIRRKR